MKQSNVWLAILILLAIAGGYYIWQMERTPVLEPMVEVQPEPIPDTPAVQYPVPDASAAQDDQQSPSPEGGADAPLPALEDSDSAMREEFDRLFPQGDFAGFFIFKSIIHRIVVTLDNLTSAKLPQKFRFTMPPPEAFLVSEPAQDQLFLDPTNYRRYAVYLSFVEAIDINVLAPVYVRYYPLFQQAYRDLGYPTAYFNDRLVEVIDHLLEAPEITTPIALVRPSVFYKFADPRLEALSAGQKIMIRIGPENAAQVKSKLRELRRSVTTLPAN